MITLERLKERLSYDPETGEWRWKTARRKSLIGQVITHKEGSGYIQFPVEGKNYRASRLAWFYMTGEWPKGLVDHIDRDKTNDRWNNLRIATRSENKANGKTYVNNKLGVKCVTKAKKCRSKPYRARINIDGKAFHLGYFATPDEANVAYLNAAKAGFGEFAYGGSS